MRFSADFNLEAWVRGVEVEGKTREEAIDELLKKTVEELIEEGYVKDSDLSEIDLTVLSKSFKIKVYNIDYAISDDEVEETGKSVSEIDATLEHEMMIELKDVEADDDLNALIADTVEDISGYFINNFDYEVVEEY